MKLARLLRDDALIDRMSADLRRFDAFANETDAIRALMGHYRSIDIVLFADDARRAAQQQRSIA